MTRFVREGSHPADSLAAYALGALDEQEAADIRAHLDECADCSDEVAELCAVVGQLPAAAPPLLPPPALKARIMGQVNAEAELLRAAGAGADRPAPRRRLSFGLFSLHPLTASLAAAALIVVGIAGFLVGGAERKSPAPAVARTSTARATVRAPGASGALVRRDGNVTLVVHRLPRPPRGKVYQVWLDQPKLESPKPTDALFTVNRQGSGHVSVPGNLRGIRRILVTIEPSGGSDVPSQPVPLITAPIPRAQ